MIYMSRYYTPPRKRIEFEMKLKNFIPPSLVANILKGGGFTTGGEYRLLDCTGAFPPRNNHAQFMKTLYGKFEEQMNMKTEQWEIFAKKHIPESVHIDLNIAMYPGKYEPYANYPPEIFQKYARLLGINKGQHIVLYGREQIAGMMLPCRIAWLFKTYGHEAVSVMDGGLSAWEKEGGETTDTIQKTKEGDWEAGWKPEYIVTYEELAKRDANGKDMFEKADQINFFDARPRPQFEGKADTMLDPSKIHGSRVPGTLCAPAVEMVNENGRLKDSAELEAWLKQCGLKRDRPIVSHCLRGIQACMLNLAINDLYPELKTRVYHGSCLELQARDPKRISE